MRRLLVPLTALGLLGIVIGCRSSNSCCDSCAPACNGCNGSAPVVANGQPLPGGANGKVPDMPPAKNGGEKIEPPKDSEPKDANPKDGEKDKDTESTGAPLKTAPRTAPF